MNYIIIGCGRVFEYYRLNVLPTLPSEWKLIALVEKDENKINYLKKQFKNIPIY